MTDEEKKAMQYFYNLRATIDESNMLFDEDIDVKCGKETIKQITIILNLIEKQSKEIEELKDKNKTLKNLQNDTNRLYIEMIERKNYFEGKLQKLEDKIKAKIEEVEQWELYNMKIPRLSTLGERLGAKIGIKYVLQSLLEKE